MVSHKKHRSYTNEQRQEVIELIDTYRKEIGTYRALELLDINTTTYYSWKQSLPTDTRSPSPLRITPKEKQSIIQMKKDRPTVGYRQVSGYLRGDGIYVSPVTCYNYLKLEGMIEKLNLRSPPDREPKYLPYEPCRMWALDWTRVRIEGSRWYIISIIDIFSKLLIGFGILKSVKGRDVRELVALSVMDQNIQKDDGLILVMDQGTPNVARKTIEFLTDTGITPHIIEAGRPTQNSVKERWYRTLKQEEIYAYPDGYYSEAVALSCISQYIDSYNKERPHSFIYNFTPAEMHYQFKNMSRAIEFYQARLKEVRNERLEYWREAA